MYAWICIIRLQSARLQESDIAKMDILLNGDNVDALSALIHGNRATDFGRKLMCQIERSAA
jgi:translation elongation factor EF-4